MEKLKAKFNSFVHGPENYWFLAAFSVGFYAFCFFYANNFALAFSVSQFLFFSCFYILLPIVIIGLVFFVFNLKPLRNYKRQALFILVVGFFLFFFFQSIATGHTFPLRFLAALFVVVLISFKFSNHKVIVALLWVMTLFPLFKIAKSIGYNLKENKVWNNQPDHILSAKFKTTPNVYFLEMDGYVNSSTLKNSVYQYDNSAFENFLITQGFTNYPDFRSNYNNTLSSNSSIFSMKHHKMRDNGNFRTSNDYILGENPVLQIFKANGYKTSFIAERPYLIMNRPKLAFDYSNFAIDELPYFQDGWSMERPITQILKTKIIEARKDSSSHFFFVEKFDPGHIVTLKTDSKGKKSEREKYLSKLQTANNWLYEIVPFIRSQDPSAIIIIGADHGGFVGFEYTLESQTRLTDAELLQSVFGARMAILWNGDQGKFDADLKTSVNLFRTLFAFLSQDESLLKNLQPDISYNLSVPNDADSVYEAVK